jgi:hypothetical protein
MVTRSLHLKFMTHSQEPLSVSIRTALLLLVMTLLLTTNCGDPTPTPAVGAAPPADGTVHFVWLSRLQGFGAGIPCDTTDIPALPAAAQIANDLEAQGDLAVLACVGDALIQPASITSAPAAVAATVARSNVDLDAMAAAGVDIYVPGHSDMILGLKDLADRASARGVPLVLTNVKVEGRDDIKPYVIVEHGGMRFALLGVIPKESMRTDQEALSDQSGVTFTSPGRAVRELSRDILNRGEANAVVCFSSLTVESNQNLCKIPTLHFLIGSSEAKIDQQEVVSLNGTSMFLQPIAGRSVGLTTIRVVNDDWELPDISQRHVLPKLLELERKKFNDYVVMFGTDNVRELAPLVLPLHPENFILKCELMEENTVWVEEVRTWPGSFLDHQSAVLEPILDDDPVAAVFEGYGNAMRTALADLKRPLEVLPEEPTIPRPQDCRGCHSEQFEFWAATPHANSYDRLTDLGRQNDSSCLICHTTGFGLMGGYRDPRHEAPFGSVGCLHCHEVQGPHAFNKRLVVDPLYVTANPEAMTCQTCHNADRDPDFDRNSAIEAIACPPMRIDDPALLVAWSEAQKTIQRMRARGKATDWEDYLEGRALVGMGRPEEGLPLIKSYMKEHTEWPELTYYTSKYLEEHRDAPGSLVLLREYIAGQPGDMQMNIAYIRLLMTSDDDSVRDEDHALSHAQLIAPPDAPELIEVLMPAYLIQVDMLVERGRGTEAFELLQKLKGTFNQNEDLDAALRKHGLLAS